jgi:hypothetical protein
MTIRQSEGHTFIIRMRRQNREPEASRDDWQGEVVHVPTQRSESFRGLEKLPTIIGRLIEQQS